MINDNKYLQNIFVNALKKLYPNSTVQFEKLDFSFDIPKKSEHGDLATNICLRLAKSLQINPQNLANSIVNELNFDKKNIESVTVAGAGFINVKFTKNYYHEQLKFMCSKGANFGKYINEFVNESGEKKQKKGTVNVEYVSANPTGLLHLGHGRNAAIGDTLANLYEWTGWEVTREYYFNNAGNQMANLTKSIHARIMQILENENYPFPEDGYHGDYVKEIAAEIVTVNQKLRNQKSSNSRDFTELNEENFAYIKKYGEEWCFGKIKNTLKRMNISQDVFYNEDSLYKNGKIEQILNDFKNKGLSYEKDGAIWLSLSKLGLEDDRVIVKSSGEPTYRLPDIAYHREKLLRGFDLVVDLFGADHIATVPDVLAGVRALGFDSEKVKVVIHQFVTLTENGEQVKMSKRTGKSYTLDELLDDVGEDVVRFFLIMRGVNTHLEFDLSLAKEQNDKNPVFYLQYAHARISSIFDKIKEKNLGISNENLDISSINLELLTNSTEIRLIKQLMLFPSILELACFKSEPHIVCDYLYEVASAFHLFYHDCRIIGEDLELMRSRLLLANVVRTVIYNGLQILGISAPTVM